MPKDDKRKELTQEEIDAQNEKFRTFFSTSVAQVPEEMKRRDEEKENTGSLLGKLFHREKDKEEPAAAPAVQNELPPTGRSCWAMRKKPRPAWSWHWSPESWRKQSLWLCPPRRKPPQRRSRNPGPHPSPRKSRSRPAAGNP